MKRTGPPQKKNIPDPLSDIPLPSDEKIASLASLLSRKLEKEHHTRKYASVKHVLTLLGIGVFIGASFVVPPILIAAKPFLDAKREDEYKAWKQFNPSYLKRTLARLKKEKLVTVIEKDGEQQVILTKNGKRRILKYALDDISIDEPKNWDGKWRLVMYDVTHYRKRMRDLFRETLKTLGFYQLQESVWLYPYPCEDQISFLKEYYDVGNEVIYVIASKLEDDAPYRVYFGLG